MSGNILLKAVKHSIQTLHGSIDGGFEIPTDRNKQPLIEDYEVNADGSVLVKTYHREHPSAPAFARNERDGLADGEPVDIRLASSSAFV
jgi:hypothetical protein